MRFIGLHSLPGFTQEMLKQKEMKGIGELKLLRLHALEGGKLICEVEAPSREAFISWLNKINFPYDEIHKVEMSLHVGNEVNNNLKPSRS